MSECKKEVTSLKSEVRDMSDKLSETTHVVSSKTSESSGKFGKTVSLSARKGLCSGTRGSDCTLYTVVRASGHTLEVKTTSGSREGDSRDTPVVKSTRGASMVSPS